MTAVSLLAGGRWNAQHLYFTGTSLALDDARLVILGDRDRPARGPYDPDAAVNVFVVDVGSGDTERLTENTAGVARSYVYFGGHRGRGIAPGSVAFDPATRTIGLVQDHAVARVNLDGGRPTVLAELPPDVVPGYGSISDGGDRYAVPVIDEAAFADLHTIDATVRRLGLVSHVLVYELSTGALVDDVAVPGAWVTHVHFRPGDASTILFNHEWAEGSGHRRMWLRDRGSERPLRAGEAARTDGPIDAGDDVEHEVFTPDGSAVVYHGVYRSAGEMRGRSFVGRVTLDDGVVTELALPVGFTRYGHIAARDATTLVTDGIAEPAEADPGVAPSGDTPQSRATNLTRLDGADAPAEDDGGRWITLMEVDWAGRELTLRPLVEHGSSWSSQDAHPHPTFDHAGRSVVFTTDRDGYRAVVRVATRDI